MISQSQECVIICNGPSVEALEFARQRGFDLKSKYIIAVNRWASVFQRLNFPLPNAVVVGAQSITDNADLIDRLPQVDFYLHVNDHVKQFPGRKNIKTTPKGEVIIEGKRIHFDNSLWWSGAYQIQLALSLGFQKIHIFGFTCTDGPDYKDGYNRAPLPDANLQRLEAFFAELTQNGFDQRLYIYEESCQWKFNRIIGHRRNAVSPYVELIPGITL